MCASTEALCHRHLGTVKNNEEGPQELFEFERLRRLKQLGTNALRVRLYAAVCWPRLHCKYINEFMILADP